MTIKEIVDGVFDEITELKDEHTQFKQSKIDKAYIYAEEFRLPAVINWGFFIRPGAPWKFRIPLLGNRMDEVYNIDIIVVLKIDAKKNDYYFTNGLNLIEDKLTHNTLNGTVQVVGNNVTWEQIDMGEARVMTAIVRYQARKIVNTN